MNTLSWDQYFINIAYSVAEKSKDPSTKVGAVIVDQDNCPVSFGFNGFIAGCDEEYMTFERPMKYLTILHAEINAILFAKGSLKGCKLYSTQAPCENCLKYIFQSRIIEVYYDKDTVVIERSSQQQKEAIARLIMSMGNSVTVQDIYGNNYIDKLLVKSEIPFKQLSRNPSPNLGM